MYTSVQVIVGTVSVLLVVVAMLLAWILSRRTFRESSQISSGVVSISDSDMSGDVDGQRASELAELLHALRQMQAALRATIETIDHSTGKLTTAADEMSLVAGSGADGLRKRSVQLDEALEMTFQHKDVRSRELVLKNNTPEQGAARNTLRSIQRPDQPSGSKAGITAFSLSIRRIRNPARVMVLDAANDVNRAVPDDRETTNAGNKRLLEGKPAPISRAEFGNIIDNYLTRTDATVSALHDSAGHAAVTLEMAKSAEVAIERIIDFISTIVPRKPDEVSSLDDTAQIKGEGNREVMVTGNRSAQLLIETPQPSLTSQELSRIPQNSTSRFHASHYETP